MIEIKHTIPVEYLNKITGSPTRRHARIVAGWLNRSHGDSRINRRVIQDEVKRWKSTHKEYNGSQ